MLGSRDEKILFNVLAVKARVLALLCWKAIPANLYLVKIIGEG